VPRTRKDHTLLKIVVLIVAVGGGGYGGLHLARGFKETYLGQMGQGKAAEDLAAARRLSGPDNTPEARAQARALLAPIAEGGAPGPTTFEALALLGRLAREEGKTAEALEAFGRAYEEFPLHPDHGAAAVDYARLLEQAGRPDEAARIYTEVCESAPPELRAPAWTGLGRLTEAAPSPEAAAALYENAGGSPTLGGTDSDPPLLRASATVAGGLVAREFYRRAVAEAAWNSSDWDEAVDALGRVNTELIFSAARTPESKRYTVKRGDSITGIGNALNTTQGLLLRANGLDADATLTLNRQMKHTPKDFRIVIERSKCRLFLMERDGIFKRYVVGLGKPGHETNLGAYKIGNKQKNPTWYKPGEGPIPSGDPRNELGTRWMPLVPVQEGLPEDLGIHGTIAPETIGKHSSHGCARLYAEEVEELYDLVVRSTPVDIVERFTWEGPGVTRPTDAAPTAGSE